MHFSCKISNAVLTYLETQGDDLNLLYEQIPVPAEFLRDTSYWLVAPEMESVLEAILRYKLDSVGVILQKAGHYGPQLRAWGVLDSVMKMMPRPQEVFNNPEQFLSYFISPKPPVDHFVRLETSVAFDLPLPAELYPRVTSYLKAALEALPAYVGQPIGHCTWKEIRFEMSWPQQQSSMIADNQLRQLTPELFQSLIDDLQNKQSEKEDLYRQIQNLEAKIKDYELKLQKPSANLSTHWIENKNASIEDHPRHILGQNLARLHDYMVRAQQLITMLAAQGKMSGAVKEAMRRVDWDYVKSQYPLTVGESMEIVRQTFKLHSNKDEQQQERFPYV